MNTQTIRILLIEDNPDDVRLLRASLARIEQPYFDLVCADYLAAGLARLATRAHDVVLLDLTLPDSVGFATFTHVRRQAADLPIVILTGLDDEELAVRAVHEGAQDYLLKDNLDGRLLARVIRYAIERNQAELALRAAHDELERRVEERTAALAAASRTLQVEITERKLAEEMIRAANEQLHHLAQQVITAQEDERRRLSRELHDEAGQALTALKINLELVRADLPAGAEALGQRLEDAVALTGATLEQLRTLAQDLRPPALDAVGLGPALDDLGRGFARHTGLRVVYVGAELPALPDAVNIALYRFLQEALTNVARHAAARQVAVTLRSDAEAVSLTVADDGKGFDRAAAAGRPRPAGLGLLGMRERIELVGGRLLVESTPGGGARLTAHIPRAEEP